MSSYQETRLAVYNVQYKNLFVKMKFNDVTAFMIKYPTTLDEALNTILVDSNTLSSVASALIALDGIYSVEVTDRNTGSGVELIREQLVIKPIKKIKS
jgi:hypothetical protein